MAASLLSWDIIGHTPFLQNKLKSFKVMELKDEGGCECGDEGFDEDSDEDDDEGWMIDSERLGGFGDWLTD